MNNTENNIANPSPTSVLIIVTGLLLAGQIFSSLLIMPLANAFGVNYTEAMNQLVLGEAINAPSFFRVSLLIGHFCNFWLPAFVTIYYFYQKQTFHYFQIDKKPNFWLSVLGILLILCSIPLVQYLYWLNRQMPLSRWAEAMEASNNALLKMIIVTPNIGMMIFNVIVIALIPAIGEELIFRGIIQRQLGRIFRQPDIAIWVGAIIFSAIHLQFEGFLPRVLLGAMLGYLFYWSGSLWIAMFAHFANNALQLIVFYANGQNLGDLEEGKTEPFQWWVAIISLGLMIILGSFFQRKALNKQVTHT